jgi:peptidylprolyl isomerase
MNALRCLPLSLLVLFVACEEKPTATAEAPPATPKAVATPTPPPAPAEPSPPPRPTAIPAPEDVAKAPVDAKTTASGLKSKVLEPGDGKKKPGPSDRVKVHYTGWTTDGKMFDSSILRGTPTIFGVSEVIKGWTEGLQLMVAGEKRRMWIPATLAYGDSARMGGPSGNLVFDVQLIEIIEPPKAPPDVKKAPADAKKTESGLAYKLLKKGTGTEHPTPTQRVTVHYTGWTPDGKMFDSSETRGSPATFALNGVIKGWTEGVQLMKVGDKMRFWIPSQLAYGDKPARPGAPTGPLVFDVELLEMR